MKPRGQGESYKDQKAVMVDLKKVYQALTLEEAEFAFETFKETWGKKHPIVIKSWESLLNHS